MSANKKYNINVIFDVKDTSKTYYYIWKNYFYDEVNYRTECKKVVPGEHKGSFTVNGKRKANVTVYSDSSCTSEVTSVDSKTYTCRGGCPNDVDATFKPQNSVTSISKGTKYKINIDFKIRDKAHSYYYIWSNYLNGSNNYNTKCTKVTEGEHEGSFTVNGTRKVNVTLYRDASCQKKIKAIESKTYKCSNCPPLTISVGRNLSSSQTNGTVINNGFIFNIIDNTDTYYYKWRTYNNGSLWVEGSCIKVPTNGKQEVRDLTINSDLRVRKGTITVYSDSSCKNRISSVPIAETTTYRCSNCDEVYNNNNSNSYNNNTYNNSSSKNSSSSKNNSNSKSSSSSSGKSSSDSFLQKYPCAPDCCTCFGYGTPAGEAYELVPWMDGLKITYKCQHFHKECGDGRYFDRIDGKCHVRGASCIKKGQSWINLVSNEKYNTEEKCLDSTKPKNPKTIVDIGKTKDPICFP